MKGGSSGELRLPAGLWESGLPVPDVLAVQSGMSALMKDHE